MFMPNRHPLASIPTLNNSGAADYISSYVAFGLPKLTGLQTHKNSDFLVLPIAVSFWNA